MSNSFKVTSPEELVAPVKYNTVPEYLLEKAKECGENQNSYFSIDAVSKEKRFFHKFDEETRKIASALYKAGLRKGDSAIYMASDMIKLHMFLCGVWRANGFCRASYIDDGPAIIEHKIRETNTKIILCDPFRIGILKESLTNIEWFVEIITTQQAPGYRSVQDILDAEDGQDCPTLNITGEDIALILSTSGTTGMPKGAVYTHATLVQHIHLLTYHPFCDSKPNLMFSTASHYSGSVFTFGLLASGKTAIVTNAITKDLLRKTVHEMKPGLAFALPANLVALIEPEAQGYDFSSLEILLMIGVVVTPAMKAEFLKLPNVKDIVNGYGLSETGIVITTSVMSRNKVTPTYRDTPDFSVGKCHPGTYAQILDLETKEPLGPNCRGELCLYNDILFQCYFKNAKVTEEALHNGYLLTGDIGYYDENGFIYVVDRFKEIFKYQGNQISPSELENVIGQHPLVNEVCVFPIPDPDGEVPRAVVTINGTQTPALADEIKEFVDGKVPPYKQLRGGVFVVSELPKGKTGKVSRSLVAQMEL